MTLHISNAEPSHEKTTLIGLRQRIDAIVDAKDGAPTPLTRKQFDKLDALAQASYDNERIHWFNNGLYIQNPAQRDLEKTALAFMRMHDPNTVGEHGIVLTGPAHVGKTSALVRLARQIEWWTRKYNPTFREQGITPVVYIEMQPKASPKSIASSVLTFYRIPHNFKTATQHELTAQAIGALRRHSTQVLIIDEVQMLKLQGKMGDDAVNALKTFMNGSGAICVFTGVDLTTGLASRAAEQIMARCRVIQMQPFIGSDNDTRAGWAAIVKAFGSAMNLLDVEPDHLAPFADPLLGLSNGKIGNLRRLLGLAMIDAIAEREELGIEVITSASISGIGSIGVA